MKIKLPTPVAPIFESWLNEQGFEKGKNKDWKKTANAKMTSFVFEFYNRDSSFKTVWRQRLEELTLLGLTKLCYERGKADVENKLIRQVQTLEQTVSERNAEIGGLQGIVSGLQQANVQKEQRIAELEKELQATSELSELYKPKYEGLKNSLLNTIKNWSGKKRKIIDSAISAYL